MKPILASEIFIQRETSDVVEEIMSCEGIIINKFLQTNFGFDTSYSGHFTMEPEHVQLLYKHLTKMYKRLKDDDSERFQKVVKSSYNSVKQVAIKVIPTMRQNDRLFYQTRDVRS